MAHSYTNSRLTASGNVPELSMSEGDILNSNSGRTNGKVAPTPRSKDRAPPLPLRMVPSSSQSPYHSVLREPSSLALDAVDYSTKLPRRKKQRCAGCWNLSAFAWLFLVLAFLQAILVTGLQIAIAILGRFRESRLNEYVDCLEDSIGVPIRDNITGIPSFGEDKEIYIYLFIVLAMYNFFLCFYALKVQNIVEVYMFVLINILAMMYACVQVFQFRGFGDECDPITTVGYIALANVLVLLAFTIVFAVLSFFIFVEFGWKIYKEVRCDAEIRHYYRWYEVFMSAVKLLILFLVIFCAGQCILILQGNYEFYLTILLAIFAIAMYPLTYIIVRRESLLGSILLVIIGVMSAGYNIFKIVRYATLTCPLCEEAEEEADEVESSIREELAATSSGSGDIADIDFELLNRGEQFQHLIMIGVINVLVSVVLVVIFIRVWRNYHKGLKEKYFDNQPPLFKCFGSSDDDNTTDDERHHGILGLWSSSRRRRRKRSTAKSTRDSEIRETFSPMNPEFSTAPATIFATANQRSNTLPSIKEENPFQV